MTHVYLYILYIFRSEIKIKKYMYNCIRECDINNTITI